MDGLGCRAALFALTPNEANKVEAVNLIDAIAIFKMIVGLNAPAPTWTYFDDAKLASAYNATQLLSHKSWSAGAEMDASSTADSTVKLVGVLTGDVDGSWAG